ncbi:TfoX/Sxy family protein [Undibacterium sp. JH2W]|uniref:TfoX/Sxy family protein n=1 Tax=Undibacterium sp. JH2W TaxID=3413037 RepID=UPI003BF09C43
MASQASFVAFILDQLSASEGLIAKKMFGEYALYLNEKMFALICDDQLFIKPTAASRAFLEQIGPLSEAPPYPQAKAWFLIESDLLEDREQLAALAQCTAASLPVPVKKIKKAKA